MGKYVDYYCGNNNKKIKTLVDKIIKSHFGWVSYKDYDDFYSIAAQVVWDCEKRFDDSHNTKFETYLISCLHRKIKTRITYMNRDKRCSKMPDIPLEKLIDEEGSLALGDLITTQSDEEELSDKTQRYIERLSSKQRDIARLIMDGYDLETIRKVLNLSPRRFKSIYQRMKSRVRE